MLSILLSLGLAPAGLALAQAHEAHRFHDESGREAAFVRFRLTSTKVGFITTGVDGHVRDFELSYEREGQRVEDVRLSFPVRAMTTDNGGRDEKMWGFCLDAEDYPDIEVRIPGPVSAAMHGDVLGRIRIRGQWHPIPITLSARSGPDGAVVEGSAVVSLARLGIPDPSIWIAHVHDDVRVEFRLAIPTAQHASR